MMDGQYDAVVSASFQTPRNPVGIEHAQTVCTRLYSPPLQEPGHEARGEVAPCPHTIKLLVSHQSEYKKKKPNEGQPHHAHLLTTSPPLLTVMVLSL